MIRYSFWLLLPLCFSRCTNAPESHRLEEMPAEAKQAGPAKHHVSIMAMKFDPNVIKVHKGDTITFENQDFVDHDVTEEKTQAWTSSVLKPGASWRMAATESSDYFCSIHVVMKGKIIVE